MMQPITSLKWLSAFATAGLFFAPLADAQTSSTSQPAGSKQQSTPEQLVDALNGVFGKQKPDVRAVHAKGVDLTGVFRPSGSASSVSKAPHLQKTIVPVTVRFSNFPGVTTVPDTDGLSSPRGMSIKFRLPDGSDTDIVAHSFNGFPAPTADEFRVFLIALGASGPGAAKPTSLDVYLGSHPVAKTFLESQIPPPLSYGTVSYFGVNAFKFTNAKGTVTFGRYQIRPLEGDQSLPKAEIAKADPNYLAKEMRERVTRGPVRFKLVLEIAEKGDKLDDPSVAWPPTRTKVELGTIEITKAVADNAAAEHQLLFLPGALPPGIEAADPMIKARTDAYPVSFDRRK
jgi:catalase